MNSYRNTPTEGEAAINDPIWDTPAIKILGDIQKTEINSPRCGGLYITQFPWKEKVRDLDNREKTRLTSWLIKQRRSGNERPEINDHVIEYIKRQRNMTVPGRADATLKYLDSKTHEIGENVNFACPNSIENFRNSPLMERKSISLEQNNHYNLLAFSESINYSELDFILKYLVRQNWIECNYVSAGSRNRYCQLTVEGYARLTEMQESNEESSSGFMAMWFDDTMEKVWEKGFELGIIQAGYEPMRISNKHHNNNIVDEIIAEIRRSRFVVADLTHRTEEGVRGSVYYEAGFAHGLNIPVIFTCRKGCKVHFDVQQYNCIFWQEDKLEELQENLTNRITGTIGDGPIRSAD